MILKKLLLTLIAPLALLTSCLDTKPVDYLQYVVGQWTLVQQNNDPFITDSIKVMTINTDFSVTYAYGEPQTGGRMVWEKGGGLIFSFDNNVITIKSIAGAERPILVEMNIVYVTGIQMVCTLTKMEIDGVQMARGQILNFEKSVFKLQNEIVGIWQSRLQADGNVWIWNIKAGGLYDFYLYNPTTKEYKARIENQSTYNLYGRYLVFQFNDGVTGEAAGQNAEAFLISGFSITSMVITSVNAQGKYVILPIARIQNLP